MKELEQFGMNIKSAIAEFVKAFELTSNQIKRAFQAPKPRITSSYAPSPFEGRDI